MKRTELETKQAVWKSEGIDAETLNLWIAEFLPQNRPDMDVRPKIGTVADFVKRVRSVLWQTDRVQYNHWLERVSHFQEKSYALPEAQVRAAKEFPVLIQFFPEYDLKHLDRDPGSHQGVVFFGDEKKDQTVKCQGIEQSYRENLRWAANAAGQHIRTGEEFYTVPNDTAFYLYQQALSDPKDFITKLGTIEGREDMEAMLDKNTRKATERSVEELDKWLSEIDDEVDPNGEATEKAASLFFKEAAEKGVAWKNA